jgi:large subunit ribosomal protein L2
MAIKTFRPKTHSLRFKTVIDYKQEITTDEPHKPLLDRKNRINGRDNYGQITVRHRGGGNKKHYRIIDFKRDKAGIPAKVESVEYDPNRSAFIALLSYADGERRYILQPVGLKVGMTVVSGPEVDILVGNSLPLEDIRSARLSITSSCGPARVRRWREAPECCAAGCKKRADTHSEVAFGRDETGECRVHATIGQVGNLDPRERDHRKSRADAAHGQTADGPGCRDEPRRSPAWRW